MATADGIMFADIAGWIKEKYSPAYKVRNDLLPACLLNCIGCMTCNKELKCMMALWNVKRNFNNQKTRTELGIEYRDLKTGVLEMVEHLIDTGYEGL